MTPKKVTKGVVDTARTTEGTEPEPPVIVPESRKAGSSVTFSVTLLVAFTGVTVLGSRGPCDLAVAAQTNSRSVRVKSFPFIAASSFFPI